MLRAPAHVRGDDRRQLGHRLGGDRAVVAGDQAQEAAHGGDLAHPRAVALGDEQAGRVGADVDARAAHLVAIISSR